MRYHLMSELLTACKELKLPMWQIICMEDAKERQVSEEESFETMRQMYESMREADESYDAICKAGFSERMLYGTDFPITHYVELSETKHVQSDFQPAFEELCKNYKKLKLKSDCLIV